MKSNFYNVCFAVNLGGDADTVGAIYGQLGGAFYGVEAIPAEWRQKCALASLIELVADELVQLSDSISIPSIPIPETVDWSQVNAPVPHDKCKLYNSVVLLILIILHYTYSALTVLLSLYHNNVLLFYI